MPQYAEYPAIASAALADADLLVISHAGVSYKMTFAQLKLFMGRGGSFRGVWVETNNYIVGDLAYDVAAGGLFRCIATDTYDAEIGGPYPAPSDNINKWASAENAPRMKIRTISLGGAQTVSKTFIGDRVLNRLGHTSNIDFNVFIPNYDPVPNASANWAEGAVLNIRNTNTIGNIVLAPVTSGGNAILKGPILSIPPLCNAQLVYVGSNTWDVTI